MKHTIKKKAPFRPIESIPDLCLSFGTCSAGCPTTGISGFDPGKIVRMIKIIKTGG
jgi:heterodisulfide reductase subunit C